MPLDEQIPNDTRNTEPSVPSRPQDQARDYLEPHEAGGTTAKAEPTAESLLSSETSTAAQSGSRRRKRTTLALWGQELIAALLLCAAVIASYATLAPYHGKSLPEWPRYITISALLSLYSVVLRLAATFLLAEGLAQLKWRWFNRRGGAPLRDLVLHDNATRGPIGSLRFLWRLPLPVTWQWLGCVLVVAALATGPLTQLVLQYEQCPVLMDINARNASIPRASVFIGQGTHSGAAMNALTVPEQNSVNAGIYSLGSVTPECGSGNCTFAPYTSVGYSWNCTDISDRMQFAMLSNGGVSSFIPGGPRTNSTPAGSGPIANYVVGGTFMGPFDENYTIVIGPPHMGKDGTFTDCSNNRTWACQGYAAATCRLNPCIRNYTASVTNGVFQETVVNTWTLPASAASVSFGNAYAYSSINKSCLTVPQSSELRSLGYKTDDDSPWLGYNGSFAKGANSNMSMAMEQYLLDRGCLFAVDTFFDFGLRQYSRSALEGNVTGTLDIYNHVLGLQGPQLLLAIYNGGDISFQRTQAVFENVSLSLTNYIRANPYGGYNVRKLNQTNPPAPGLAYTIKTCLQVRWAWLVFPTALSALTLVFFTGVILSSGSLTDDVRTWKSSPLPLLFYGSSVSELSTASQHVSDLDSAAKRTQVSLTEDEEGNLVLRRQGGMVERYSEL